MVNKLLGRGEKVLLPGSSGSVEEYAGFHLRGQPRAFALSIRNVVSQ